MEQEARIPVCRNWRTGVVCGGILSLEAMLPVCLLPLCWREGAYGAGLFMLAIGFALVGFAFCLILRSLARLRITRKGMTLTILGRRCREIPAEKLCFAWRAETWNGKNYFDILGISSVPQGELIRRREAQLRKGIFTRDELKFRKRAADWKKTFLKEYLKKAARHPFSRLFGEEVLVLEGDILCGKEKLLKQYYPRVKWYNFCSRLAEASAQDRRPDHFLRGRTGKGDSGALALFVFVMFFPLLALLFVDTARSAVLVVSALLLTIALLLRPVLRLEEEELVPREDGIHIYRKQQQAGVFPAAKIRTVGVVFSVDSSSYVPYLVVTPRTPEELAAAQRARMEKRAGCQDALAALMQLPDWETLLALQELSRQVFWTEYRNQETLVMAYAPERMGTLRNMYPNAVFLDGAFPGADAE